MHPQVCSVLCLVRVHSLCCLSSTASSTASSIAITAPPTASPTEFTCCTSTRVRLLPQMHAAAPPPLPTASIHTNIRGGNTTTPWPQMHKKKTTRKKNKTTRNTTTAWPRMHSAASLADSGLCKKKIHTHVKKKKRLKIND